MCEIRFFVCEHCGNIVGLIHNAGVPMMCCGTKMVELVPNTEEASVEKHLPVVSVDTDKVNVKIGDVAHPMLSEHLIMWVYLQTDRGGQRKCLEIGAEPEVTFALADEKPVAVYAYCNIHGLWKTEIK
ncbi:MAG: desulfoferrodoxin [Ruminococcus sp.]|nr:desulfoferrodoxin [Ruminococcus sp.]